MVIPVLALLLIVSVVVGGGILASSQTRYPVQGGTGEYRRPVEAGTFIVGMVFLAILAVVFIPLLIVMVIVFW